MQLYDTIQVRHGLMLVGPTGGGKTQNYRVLQRALSDLKDDGFYTVNTHKLNPKSITMGQLYGEFNDMTHEWTDGILANMIRETVKDLSGEKHWIVFDGPVDAIWIENMNTVLDDNKKLCLNSGQILTLTPHMTMMFEVEDLEVASPATRQLAAWHSTKSPKNCASEITSIIRFAHQQLEIICAHRCA
jgi:dynein heavy chain